MTISTVIIRVCLYVDKLGYFYIFMLFNYQNIFHSTSFHVNMCIPTGTFITCHLNYIIHAEIKL